MRFTNSLEDCIIWQGNSPIDAAPIVAILTGLNSQSANTKTGDMPQVWILRSDVHPVEALRSGEDVSICGNCPHRPKQGGEKALSKAERTCYVNPMSFSGVYKKFAADGYPIHSDLPLLGYDLEAAGSRVRLGAYGDPACIPLAILEAAFNRIPTTGYTHRWRECSTEYAAWTMASCETLQDVAAARMLGYRVFYAAAEPEKYDLSHKRFATCPASKEAGKVTTCRECMACGGSRIQPHTGMAYKSLISIRLH